MTLSEYGIEIGRSRQRAEGNPSRNPGERSAERSALDLNRNRKGKSPLKPKTSVPFHLDTDGLDDLDKANGTLCKHNSYSENNTVYLEMQGVQFSATKDSVTVGIPPDVWNRIVAAGPVKVRKGHGPEFPERKPRKPRNRRVPS